MRPSRELYHVEGRKEDAEYEGEGNDKKLDALRVFHCIIFNLAAIIIAATDFFRLFEI